MKIIFLNIILGFLRLLDEGLAGGPDTIKRQDYFAMMGYMSRHSVGRETAWAFYKENYTRLVEM